jgi:hypothetical protein
MNYTELIHDFLDGALEQAEEEELLLAVARRSDLREELRQAIALKTAFKTDFQALTPPMHLTNSIFGALGFTAPAASASSTAASSVAAAGIARLGMSSRLGAFFGAFQNSFVSALTSSLLTAVLLLSWNYFMPQNGGSRGETLLATTTIRSATPSSAPQRSIKIDENTLTRNEMLSASHRKTATEQQDLWQKHTERFDNGDDLMQFSAIHSEQHTSNADQSILHEFVLPTTPDNADFTPPKLPTLTEYIAPAPIATQMLTTDRATTPDTFWNHLQIGARGIASMSLPQATLSSNQSTFLRNTALSGMYQLSEQHLIGVEVGEETYFQRFRMRDGESNLLDVQQNPSLLWAGIAYQYVAMPESTVSPILHAVLGGTQLGATGRMMAGLNYSPDARTQFTFGLESSALVYTHQGTWYASPKIGITYGITLKL